MISVNLRWFLLVIMGKQEGQQPMAEIPDHYADLGELTECVESEYAKKLRDMCGFLDDVQIAISEGRREDAQRSMDRLFTYAMEHLEPETVRFLFVDVMP